mmetsp:Transcript_20527/g.66682  ORF Transcript_20527/g.66682 Transcript_20527/m.66682 type:complete len:225 (-) Transcript_20527:58-732(-)
MPDVHANSVERDGAADAAAHARAVRQRPRHRDAPLPARGRTRLRHLWRRGRREHPQVVPGHPRRRGGTAGPRPRGHLLLPDPGASAAPVGGLDRVGATRVRRRGAEEGAGEGRPAEPPPRARAGSARRPLRAQPTPRHPDRRLCARRDGARRGRRADRHRGGRGGLARRIHRLHHFAGHHLRAHVPARPLRAARALRGCPRTLGDGHGAGRCAESDAMRSPDFL